MARILERLTALSAAKLKAPGRYPDGGGLYLQISSAAARSWIFRYGRDGHYREMGLGPYHDVSLAEARDKAAACRLQLREGIDPIDARRSERARTQLEAARSITFKDAAETYIKVHRAGWRNAKHAGQWDTTIRAYAEPIIGVVPVQRVDTALVLKILEPIWTTKPETASRLRGRIEAILGWATARGYRTGENPARWRGHIDKLLPNKSKVRAVRHHAALPYHQIAQFMGTLKGQEGNAARALEFLIVTAARTAEVLGAKWPEIDEKEAIWRLPAARMKGGREHRVPLSTRALAVLKAIRDQGDGQFIFAGARPNEPLSNMALLAVLRRMGRTDLTAHGFRSTFRDWAAECTNYPAEVPEMALAHAVGDKVEAAYRRGDLFEKRRALMSDWAAYCHLSPPVAMVSNNSKKMAGAD